MNFSVLKRRSRYSGITYAMILSVATTIVLLIVEIIKAHSDYYIFLLTNLILAFLPLIVAYFLAKRLKKTPWLSFVNILLTLLWLGFLPNSFYMVTDLIHAQDSVSIDLLYNIVMIMFCIFNSLVAGYMSLYIIHWELLKRFYYKHAHTIIGLVILICSFAIYLGRFLRWNSWDVIVSPAGILFDVSDTITNPSTHPELLTTTVTFFLLLGIIYIVAWQLLGLVRKTE